MRAAIETALDAAQEAGVHSGLYASSPADGREWAARGASLVAIGSDVGVLQRGTTQLFTAVRGGW